MLTSTLSTDDPRPSVLADLAEIVRDLRYSRSLIFQLTLRDIRVRYKQAAMGVAWALLAPLLLVAAGVVMRVALLHMVGKPVSMLAVAGIVIKGLAWSFVAGATTFATTALTNNAPLISKVYFPREALPVSVILAASFDSLIGTSTLALIMPLLGWTPSWAILWVPVLVVVLFTLTLAVALLVSCANLFFRDVKYVVQLLVTFGVFFTPVFYDPQALGAKWISVQMLNPIAPILQGLSLAVVNGHNLLSPIIDAADGAVVWSPYYLYYSMACAFGGLVISAVIFHRAHFRFAEYV
jgi:ABC-type polysaccharide/polyol phosphate export permease